MKRPVNFHELLWTMLLFCLIQNYSTGMLITVIVLCPAWVVVYDRAVIFNEAKKRNNEQGDK